MIILISGDKNIGKTTIINKLSQTFECTGIITEEFFCKNERKGFLIRQLNEKPDENNAIAIMDKNFKPIINSDIFNKVGSQMCLKCINDNKKIVLIDEIGVFESNSFLFLEHLQKLMECGKIVIAVLKNRDSDFLSKLRQKYPVHFVTLENRDEIFNEIKNEIEGKLNWKK